MGSGVEYGVDRAPLHPTLKHNVACGQWGYGYKLPIMRVLYMFRELYVHGMRIRTLGTNRSTHPEPTRRRLNTPTGDAQSYATGARSRVAGTPSDAACMADRLVAIGIQPDGHGCRQMEGDRLSRNKIARQVHQGRKYVLLFVSRSS